MIDLQIQLNPDQIKQAEKLLHAYPVRMPIMVADAINRSIGKARTETVRAVTARYQIKAKDVRAALRLHNANRHKLFAQLISKGPELPLYRFRVIPRGITRPKRPPQGLKAGVFKDSNKQLAHAFVEQMPSGHIGVFERDGKKQRSIKELFSPAVPQMVGNKTVLDQITAQAQDMFNTRLQHAIDRMEDRP